MTNNIKFVITRLVFQAQNATKSVFSRGSDPDPAGGAYDAPPDPLVGWRGGYPLPIPLPRLTPSASRTRRLSFQSPPLNTILATAVNCSKPHGYLR